MISGMRVRRRGSAGASKVEWTLASELVRVNERTGSLANIYNSAATAMAWHPEGLYLFLPYRVSTSNCGVQRHTLTTPWDVSTLENVTGRLRLHMGSGTKGVLALSADGYRLIGVGATNTLVSYTLSTPWDITTATLTSTFSVSGLLTGDVSADGTKIILSSSNSSFRPAVQLSLSTPWEVGTATVEAQNIDPTGAGATAYKTLEYGAGGARLSMKNYGGVAMSVSEGIIKSSDYRTYEEITEGGGGFAPASIFTRTQGGRHLITLDAANNRLVHYDIHPGFSGFTDPTSIDSLQLWLDSADESTVTINTAAYIGRDGVIEWHDKSPHGTIFRPTNQSSLSPSRPYYDTTLNGLNVVRMVGSDKQYLYPSTGTAAQWSWLHDGTPHTIFCLFKRSDDQSQGVLGTNTTANAENGIGFNIRTSTNYPTVVIHQVSRGATGSVVYNSSVSGSIDTDEWVLLTLKVEPSNPYADKRSIMRKNGYHLESSSGATADPSTSDPSSLLNVGAFGEGAASMTGAIAEVIIYDRKLIQEEIDAVETYLKNKWGL